MISDDLAKKIMSDVRDDYDKTASSFASSRDRMWPELKFLFEHAQKNEKVLDVGCGNGRFSKYLKGTNYTGVDFSVNLIGEAKKRFPNEKFVVGDVLSLPFKDKSFDKVYSIAVIHQIPKEKYRLKALTEIKRVLKESGSAYITAWNIKSNPAPYFLKQKNTKTIIHYFKNFRKPRHFFLKRKRYYYIFKKGELSKLAKKAGFQVIKEGVAKEKERSNFYIILKK